MTPNASVAEGRGIVIRYQLTVVSCRGKESRSQKILTSTSMSKNMSKSIVAASPRLLALCPSLRGHSRPRNQTELVVLLEMRMGGKDADAEAVSAGFTGGNRAAI